MSMDEWLARKYAILDKQANAQAQQADAESNLQNARAGVVGQESAANIALAKAHTNQVNTAADLAPGQASAENAAKRGMADYYGAHAGILPGQAAAENAYKLAGAGQLGAQTNLTSEQAIGAHIGNMPAASGLLDQWGIGLGYRPRPLGFAAGTSDVPLQPGLNDSYDNYLAALHAQAGIPMPGQPTVTPGGAPPSPGPAAPVFGKRKAFAHGTSEVPGQGDGTVDKVPAELAPHEAVLNKGAADLVGRDVIETLNQIGLHVMGMAADPAGSNGPQKTAEPKSKPGYKKGTANVPAPKGKGMPAPKGKAAAPQPQQQDQMQPQGQMPMDAGMGGASKGAGLLAALAQLQQKGAGMP